MRLASHGRHRYHGARGSSPAARGYTSPVVPLSAVLITQNEEDKLPDGPRERRLLRRDRGGGLGLLGPDPGAGRARGGAGDPERALAGLRGPAQRRGRRRAPRLGPRPRRRRARDAARCARRSRPCAPRGFDCAGYRIPRVAFYLGRWIRATDWYPDPQVRLFDRRAARWEGVLVHESVRVRGTVGRLRSDMEHHPYRDIARPHAARSTATRRSGRSRRFEAGRRTSILEMAAPRPLGLPPQLRAEAGLRAGPRRAHGLGPELLLHLRQARQAPGARANRGPRSADEGPPRGHGPHLARRPEPGAAHGPGHGEPRPRGDAWPAARAASLEARARAAGLAVRPAPASAATSWPPAGSSRSRALLRRDAAGRRAAPRSPRRLRGAPGPTARAAAGARRRHAPRGLPPARRCLSRVKYRRLRPRDRGEPRHRRVSCAATACPTARLRLVYEGVRDRPPDAGGDAALRGARRARGRPVVGNVAALTDHKDHATLLEAAGPVVRERPDVAVRDRGRGRAARARSRRRSRALGLDGPRDLRRLSHRPGPAASRLHVFCLSSHMEGLGTSLLDAMAFGAPSWPRRRAASPKRWRTA